MTKFQTGALLALALATTAGTAFLANLSARQQQNLASFPAKPARTNVPSLDALRARIASTEASLAKPRAEVQKQAATKARQDRNDENEIRGPAVLFSDRLQSEESLIEFLQEHPLDPATREKLKALLIEESVGQREYRVKTLREKREIVFFNADINGSTTKKIRALLGEETYHLYREITLGRFSINDLDYDLKDAGVPLSSTQRRAIAHHYYESFLLPEKTSQVILPSGLRAEEETFLARSAPSLSSGQTTALRATLQNENCIAEARRTVRD